MRERGEGIAGTGILQPLLVTQNDNGYRLIAGERRYRASAQAGVEQLPVIVVAAHENGNLLAQLVENLQRRDLPPLEEARGIAQLMAEQNVSLREVARLLGKGKGYIENRINLLKMGADVQEMVSVQTDTLLHARDIDAVSDPALRAKLIRAVLEDSLSRSALRATIDKSRKQDQNGADDKPADDKALGQAGTDNNGTDNKGENTQDASRAEVSVQTDSTPASVASLPPSSSGEESQPTHKPSDHMSSGHSSSSQPSSSHSNGDSARGISTLSSDISPADDPLHSALRPAVAFVAAFGRQTQKLSMTPDYRQAVARELELLKEEIARIEKLLDR